MNTTSRSLTWEFDLITLNNYLANQNAAFEARCKAEGATFWCANALTAYDLARWGVHTVEQYKQWQAENEAMERLKDARKNGY
jgi:uncharacterized protein YqjF (DUF2071 family)